MVENGFQNVPILAQNIPQYSSGQQYPSWPAMKVVASSSSPSPSLVYFCMGGERSSLIEMGCFQCGLIGD